MISKTHVYQRKNRWNCIVWICIFSKAATALNTSVVVDKLHTHKSSDTSILYYAIYYLILYNSIMVRWPLGPHESSQQTLVKLIYVRDTESTFRNRITYFICLILRKKYEDVPTACEWNRMWNIIISICWNNYLINPQNPCFCTNEKTKI